MSPEDGDGEPPAGTPPETRPRTAEATVAIGLRAKKPLREVAVDLFGTARVAEEWHADSRMRAQLRRLVHRVHRAPAGGPPGTGESLPRTPVRWRWRGARMTRCSRRADRRTPGYRASRAEARCGTTGSRARRQDG